jgi:hypothetical protein
MGEPSCGPTPQEGGPEANVRFYFQTSNAGGFNGADWSDYYGHFGIGPYAAGFQAALSNVTDIGLSFGGGCFFENGLGTTDGSGTFTLNNFSVS